MKKKWHTIIIISFAFIFLEAFASVIFMLPHYNIRQVFDSIDQGSADKAGRYYSDLNETDRHKVISYMDDYAADIVSSYINGERSYDDTIAAMEAVSSIPETQEIAAKYIEDINHNEYKAIIDDLFNANLTYNNSKGVECQRRLNTISQRIDNAGREALLVEELNDKYQLFLDEQMSFENLNAFVSMVMGMSYYNAYGYATTIASNASQVVIYRQRYEELSRACEQQQYFDVMEGCKSIAVDFTDSNYSGKYQELYNTAYEAGKTLYYDQLVSYISSDDKENAVILMDKISKCYGDDFDLSFAESSIIQEWMRAYIEIAANADVRLQADLSVSAAGREILANSYDKYKPDSVLLYDIDGNQVPELFLFKESNIGSYTECFIYGFDGTQAVYLGFENVINFCNDSYLVVLPSGMGGEAYGLLGFYENNLALESTCSKSGSDYMVNGEVSNDVDYLTTMSGILGHVNEVTFENSGYSNLDGCEKYIMAY